MANTKAGSVHLVDTTTTTLAASRRVCGIRWMPAGTNPTVTIKAGSSSGAVLYENANAAAIFEEVCFHSSEDLYIELAGDGAKVYIYLDPGF